MPCPYGDLQTHCFPFTQRPRLLIKHRADLHELLAGRAVRNQIALIVYLFKRAVRRAITIKLTAF
jgi:hypothetical protein